MADERYQWLDPETAERLLRGAPVDPADAGPEARSGAAALAEALDAARAATTAAPGVPLAGEEAALAAFRTATAARAAAGAPSAGARESADLGRVRLAPVPAAARHWSRSLRYGLAAALAAVTVGGVAVAAGTGVLPLVDKEPSRTVTAVETASPPDPRVPTTGTERHALPSASAGPGRPAGEPAPSTSPTAGPDGGTLPTVPAPPTAPGEGRGRTGAPDEARNEAGGDAGSKARACRDYRSGRLDAAGRKRLSRALRAGETLRVYCDALLAPGTEDQDGSTGSGNGNEGGTGKSDGNKGEDDKGDGNKGEDDKAGEGETGEGKTGGGKAGEGKAGDERAGRKTPGGHQGGSRAEETGAGAGRGGEKKTKTGAEGKGGPKGDARRRDDAGTRDSWAAPAPGPTSVAALALCPAQALAPGA
ncbi:hypothetical protein ACFY9C_10555 [Streptomyces filamentosus]|uniref:hypothetical protein n=1 Tax=Streptomyces filamentosus TaxID=67294 RepID=UPI0036E9E398